MGLDCISESLNSSWESQRHACWRRVTLEGEIWVSGEYRMLSGPPLTGHWRSRAKATRDTRTRKRRIGTLEQSRDREGAWDTASPGVVPYAPSRSRLCFGGLGRKRNRYGGDDFDWFAVEQSWLVGPLADCLKCGL